MEFGHCISFGGRECNFPHRISNTLLYFAYYHISSRLVFCFFNPSSKAIAKLRASAGLYFGFVQIFSCTCLLAMFSTKMSYPRSSVCLPRSHRAASLLRTLQNRRKAYADFCFCKKMRRGPKFGFDGFEKLSTVFHYILQQTYHHPSGFTISHQCCFSGILLVSLTY